MILSPERLTAIHESGHSVIATQAFGDRVLHVRINSDVLPGLNAGETTHGTPITSLGKTGAIISMSGPLAAKRAGDRHWKAGGAVDWVHATKAARHITRDYASLHKVANELLTKYWGQIELLADYLGIEREMSGARLTQVLSYRR
jgi:hypothetical protein